MFRQERGELTQYFWLSDYMKTEPPPAIFILIILTQLTLHPQLPLPLTPVQLLTNLSPLTCQLSGSVYLTQSPVITLQVVKDNFTKRKQTPD